MNYRHIYHAGNFADLLKHLVLISIIEKMKEKPAPFTILDAFAGIGIYDLDSQEASKTLEHENGVSLFAEKITDTQDIPDICIKYNEIIDKLNNMPGLHLYPGSPYIISETIRENDSFIACELHKGDYLILRENIRQNIHNMDAYNAIKAFLPPKNNRGLVLLDPAFEVKNEFDKIIEGLKLINKRFQNGIVMIWYPIKDEKEVGKFYNDLKDTGYKEFLKIEFAIEIDRLGMTKCGLIIANPPYIHEEMKLMMHFLSEKIYNGKAKYKIEVI